MTSEVLRKVLVAGAAVAALSVAACTKPTTNTADAANAPSAAPIKPIGPSVSMGRERLRRSTSTTLTGEPSTLITRKCSSRLPGVWPFQSHSKKLK